MVRATFRWYGEEEEDQNEVVTVDYDLIQWLDMGGSDDVRLDRACENAERDFWEYGKIDDMDWEYVTEGE